MPTFDDIHAYARAKYELSDEQPGRFVLGFAFDDGRGQSIYCSKFEYAGQEWIEFRSPVCQSDELSAKVALRKNLELPLGGLALQGEVYVLVYNLPLKDLDPDQFELPLTAISMLADSLEQTYSASDRF